MKTMKAAVFEGNGILQYKDVPVPTVQRENDVLVQVEAASICGSDLHILSVPPGQRGDPGTIMGHEFVGRVAQIGTGVTLVRPGDRIVVEPNISCGMCRSCRSGHPNLCENAENIGQWRNGGFAEYCVLPEQQLHHIPEDIPAKIAALCEPLSCVMHGMMRLNPMPFERVVLFGAGAIGLIFLKLLKAFGVKHIIVCESIADRAATAIKFGAEYVFDPNCEGGLSEKIMSVWGVPANIAIDAVGAGAVLESAMTLVVNGGKILVFGQNMTQQSTIRPGMINAKEINIFAALAVHHSFPPAIELLPDLGLEELVTCELPLSKIDEAIALTREKKAIKAVVYPGK